jgi:hypothetical protein
MQTLPDASEIFGMDLGVAAMVIAIPSLSALHLRLNEVDLRSNGTFQLHGKFPG